MKDHKLLKKINSTAKEARNFLGLFAFLLLLSMVFINWGTIKGIFSYEKVYKELYQNTLSFLKSKFTSEEKDMVLRVPEVKLSEKNFEYTEKANSIEITKIGITAPIVFAQSDSSGDMALALKRGVVFYPDPVLPGNEGTTIVLGHSAPPGWPKINYDWVFTRLNELEPGDEVIIFFDHQRYPYKVSQKIILKKGDEVPDNLGQSFSKLVLLSCWPPGIDQKRIAVIAELKF